MNRVSFTHVLTLAGCAGLLFLSVAPASAAVTFEWVEVGDPGNARDTTNRGGVDQVYYISKYEVTNAQYTTFLNDVAATDLAGLYNPNMDTDPRGGIARSGAAGSYTYAVKPNMGDKPVNYVSWRDAARFVNWLENGQGNVTTDTGTYTIGTGLSEVRAPGASFFLPDVHEWYKAAYYQPLSDGSDSYWTYATASDATPSVATVDAMGSITNPGANVANYDNGADWNAQDGNVATVGSAGATSYYGTYDQSGNVREWTESTVTPFGAFHPTDRSIMGGGFDDDAFALSKNWTQGGNPPRASGEHVNIGFRVATIIPEPTSLTLLGLAASAAFAIRARRRRA